MTDHLRRSTEPRYRLRRTRKAFMVDKLVDQLDFPGEPFWDCVRSFGPFPTRESARQFMLRQGRP